MSMRPFSYVRPADAAQALPLLSATARPKGGGVDLVDLMKKGVASPATLVDLRDARELAEITSGKHGEVYLGGGATLAAVAASDLVRRLAPALSDAAAEAATPQVRSVATVAGNLLQRPRCLYFRDPFFPCRKRGGDACPAQEGHHVEGAVFDNALCCAVHPSNLAVALMAVGGPVHLLAGVVDGERVWRTPRIDTFFVGPDEDPLREARIEPGEILWRVETDAQPAASAYVEINHRQSFDWAAVSAAVSLHLAGGKMERARVALGAVAPVPLRSDAAEKALVGRAPDEAAARAAADAAVAGATPLRDNAYKVRLLRAAVRRAVLRAAERGR